MEESVRETTAEKTVLNDVCDTYAVSCSNLVAVS